MKQLYPKPEHHKAKRSSPPKEVLENRPYHVEYYDPDDAIEPEWRHYNSETVMKVDSWLQCRLLGFRPAATLYSRKELKELSEEGKNGTK